MNMGCTTTTNLKNAVIAFLAPLPSILFYLSFINNATHPFCYRHPLLLANLLFFFNVNILFWLIALIQSSHWMIDPFWTVIPVMLVHYYAAHPLAEYDCWRSRIVILLTWVWSIRLIHNYFRREKWQWGAREDWRFTDMSSTQQYGKHWWWASFFSIYLPHQLLLIGLSLPFYVIHSVNQPLNIWDLVAVAVCVSGILIAYFADNQLYNFVMMKSTDDNNGNGMILESGLWYYTRHPNYFGEQLWWWGLVVFGWNLGHGWTFIGALLNTICLGYVTKLVEQRMLKQDKRVEAYRKYQNTTSVWIPCFKFNSSANLPLKKTN